MWLIKRSEDAPPGGSLYVRSCGPGSAGTVELRGATAILHEPSRRVASSSSDDSSDHLLTVPCTSSTAMIVSSIVRPTGDYPTVLGLSDDGRGTVVQADFTQEGIVVPI